MPIYEYRCTACGYEFERLQKISDGPIEICPECGQEDVRKLVSQSGFVLKGGGWYKDHYGLKSSGGDSSASSSESSSESSASSVASDTPDSSTSSSD